MKALPMKTNGHADDCVCENCMTLNSDAPKIFGQWKTFRDFVDGMCDAHNPKEAYIYPKFAVLRFEWCTDRKSLLSYLDTHSLNLYTGVYYDDDDEYWVVLINTTEEAPNDN